MKTLLIQNYISGEGMLVGGRLVSGGEEEVLSGVPLPTQFYIDPTGNNTDATAPATAPRNLSEFIAMVPGVLDTDVILIEGGKGELPNENATVLGAGTLHGTYQPVGAARPVLNFKSNHSNYFLRIAGKAIFKDLNFACGAAGTSVSLFVPNAPITEFKLDSCLFENLDPNGSPVHVVKMEGQQVQNVTIQNNILNGCVPFSIAGVGGYGGSSSGIKILQNSIFHTTYDNGDGVKVSNVNNIEVIGNVHLRHIYGTTYKGFSFATLGGTIAITHNTAFNCALVYAGATVEANSNKNNPKIANPALGEYEILAGSAMIGTSVSNTATVDFNGSPRETWDRGALNFTALAVMYLDLGKEETGSGTGGDPWGWYGYLDACQYLPTGTTIKVKGSRISNGYNINPGYGKWIIWDQWLTTEPWRLLFYNTPDPQLQGVVLKNGIIYSDRGDIYLGFDSKMTYAYSMLEEPFLNFLCANRFRNFQGNLTNIFFQSPNDWMYYTELGRASFKGCSFDAGGFSIGQVNGVGGGRKYNFVDCIFINETSGYGDFNYATASRCAFRQGNSYFGNIGPNNQYDWDALRRFPAWDAPKEHFEKALLASSSITTPPQPGTSPYTGYNKDSWGNNRTGIGFYYMSGIANIVIFYCDLEGTETGHLGTQADPFSWDDMAIKLVYPTQWFYPLDTIKLKGMKHVQVKDFNVQVGNAGGYITFDKWLTDPWRILLENTAYGNSLFTNVVMKNGILVCQNRTLEIGGRQIPVGPIFSNMIFETKDPVGYLNFLQDGVVIPTYKGCTFKSAGDISVNLGVGGGGETSFHDCTFDCNSIVEVGGKGQ